MKPLKAVVLAAGEGIRLRPLTLYKPKVMIRVANRPILEYVVRALAQNNIRDILMVVGYRRERIMTYFEDGSRFGVSIKYEVQDKQLGTAHALSLAEGKTGPSFLALPGDNIVDPAVIKELLALEPMESPCAIAVTESHQPSKYGVVLLRGGDVTQMVEKPASLVSNLISTGIFVLSETVFETVRECAARGSHDVTAVVQSLIESGKRVRAVKTSAKWHDVVYPWDLLDINAQVLGEEAGALAGTIEPGVHIKGRVEVGEGSVIRSGTYIEGPVRIGRGCDIGPNVCILPSVSIGDNVTVQSGTEIRHSILMSDVSVGPGGLISHSVIGDGSRLGAHFIAAAERAQVIREREIHTVPCLGAILGEDAVVGSCVTVEPGVLIGSSCRIAPLKNIARPVPDNASVV
ncbi:MAG: bifunctional sugar-1-phosphate nucleotidylyltransferase/acetyltransferase [Thermoplasmatota archaeon]